MLKGFFYTDFEIKTAIIQVSQSLVKKKLNNVNCEINHYLKYPDEPLRGLSPC